MQARKGTASDYAASASSFPSPCPRHDSQRRDSQHVNAASDLHGSTLVCFGDESTRLRRTEVHAAVRAPVDLALACSGVEAVRERALEDVLAKAFDLEVLLAFALLDRVDKGRRAVLRSGAAFAPKSEDLVVRGAVDEAIALNLRRKVSHKSGTELQSRCDIP